MKNILEKFISINKIYNSSLKWQNVQLWKTNHNLFSNVLLYIKLPIL